VSFEKQNPTARHERKEVPAMNQAPRNEEEY
jgi:hypothetical protein